MLGFTNSVLRLRVVCLISVWRRRSCSGKYYFFYIVSNDDLLTYSFTDLASTRNIDAAILNILCNSKRDTCTWMWFSTKFKYLKLWWTLKWFRDFFRCRYCCHHHNHQDEDEDEEDELDSSYSLMDDGDAVLDDDKANNSSTSRTPSSNRRSVVAMPVIETFTGMF